MNTHILHCGILKVRSDKMIKSLSINRLRTFYDIDPEGYMKLNMNALLAIEGDRVVLMDPGCAEFLPSRLAEEYGLEIPVTIEEQLTRLGYGVDQVTDVIITHLHFDHGSGAFMRIPGHIVKRFPEAKYHVLREHFEYAKRPDSMEPNSFFTSFLKHIDTVHWLEDWKDDWITFRVVNGHTKGMVVPVIKTAGADICFVTDLIPMEIFMEPGVHSGYDLDPDLANREKLEFLNDLNDSTQLIYFHDPLKESVFYP